MSLPPCGPHQAGLAGAWRRPTHTPGHQIGHQRDDQYPLRLLDIRLTHVSFGLVAADWPLEPAIGIIGSEATVSVRDVQRVELPPDHLT